MIIISSLDRENPQRNIYKHKQKIDILEATLRRIVPSTDVRRLYYLPPQFSKQLRTHPGQGNVLVQYDPQQPSAA